MALAKRYAMKLKRPMADSFDQVRENFSEIERQYNRAPWGKPEILPMLGGNTFTTTITLRESLTLPVALANTGIKIEAYVLHVTNTAGGQFANYWIGVDGARDTSGGFSHDDGVSSVGGVGGSNISQCWVVTLLTAGNHTIELYNQKNINAGAFTYSGRFVVTVY